MCTKVDIPRAGQYRSTFIGGAASDTFTWRIKGGTCFFINTDRQNTIEFLHGGVSIFIFSCGNDTFIGEFELADTQEIDQIRITAGSGGVRYTIWRKDDALSAPGEKPACL